MLHISDSYIDIRVSLNAKNSFLISLRQRILRCLRMQEAFCYVIYKLKPVISITLGGGGKGLGWRIFGDHTTSEGTEEGSVVANIALKETIENYLPINC